VTEKRKEVEYTSGRGLLVCGEQGCVYWLLQRSNVCTAARILAVAVTFPIGKAASTR